ncbi:MAG TPA: heavy metal transporter [Clostridiaceae bacterium]|nr:heavy metal transporter [Clostridiaceae bacterium]
MSQSKQRVILDIEGMTCTGCENRIRNALEKLEGVTDVRVDYVAGTAEFVLDESLLPFNRIIDTLTRLGYRVTGQRSPALEDNDRNGKYPVRAGGKGASIGQVIGIGVIVLALWLIVNNTAGLDFIPEIDQSVGLSLLFTVGLLTSLHCTAMCGGICLSVCMYNKAEEGGSRFGKLKPAALYNLGRITSYTVIGGIVGALGSVIGFTGTAKGVIALISGTFMIMMGLNILNIFPWLRKITPRLPGISGKVVEGGKSGKGPFIIGLLNGLMPCGPLQAMQIYALGTGSFVMGALSMFLFSLGTVPLMFIFGAAGSLLSGRFSRGMMKVSAVMVIFLGIVMLNRGLNVAGIGITPPSTGTGNIATVRNGVQYVTTELEPNRYTPIVVQKGIPVKWTIKVEKGDLNGCNNPVTIPKLNMEIKLHPGDNLIEFTPEEEGNIIYTCWMGMITSNINVVDDINNISSD